MIQKISAPVSVVLTFSHRQRTVRPVKLVWDGHEHVITKIGFHHTYWQGRTLYHVFSVASPSMFFRLVLNTQNLFWILEEVSDDLPA
ncbi:MAG: hypothetical protein WC686_00315 [Candidatus Shapirobacteria bacterium]